MAARRPSFLRSGPNTARCVWAVYPFALGALLCAFIVSPAQSQRLGVRAAAAVGRTPKNVVANAVREASRRFKIPAAWLCAVMRAESHGDANSVSEKGAIGLMQVMPQTYAELRVKHGFGPDPFDRHDNILAGAAYLADMFRRYGAPGFLAAYNAGPGRYEEHLARGRPLPVETTKYVARLAPELGLTSIQATQMHVRFNAVDAPIFVMSSAVKAESEAPADRTAKTSESATKAVAHVLFPASQDDKLFAHKTPFDGTSNASPGAAPARTGGLFVARAAPEDAQ